MKEAVEKNWKEFFMAIAVAVVFVFQAVNQMDIHENNTFLEDMEKNSHEIREKLTVGVNKLIDVRCSEHLIEHHMEQIDE